MVWSKRQQQEHENNFEKYKSNYLNGKNGSISVKDAEHDKRRCAVLIHVPDMTSNIHNISKELQKISGLYIQEIPHWTIDCHRYKTENQLPENINCLPTLEQNLALISKEEFQTYNKIVKEFTKKEQPYEIGLNGIAIGGDGLIAQVWFDDKRLEDFTNRLGEKVRTEIPSMDFQWGIVKNHVPIRVANIARFTGKENKDKIICYAEANRKRDLGSFTLTGLNFYTGDHYLQAKNSRCQAFFSFAD